jgi:hypothetical protein
MSASDHLSPLQFYHGSPQEVAGEVKPTPKLLYNKPQAYFTTSRDLAIHSYAHSTGSYGYLYTVEPTGDHHPDEQENASYRTEYPLRVVKREKIRQREAAE